MASLNFVPYTINNLIGGVKHTLPQSVVMDFERSIANHMSPEFEMATSRLYDFVCGNSTSDISKEDFQFLEMTLKAVFEEFAMSNGIFTGLPLNVQQLLLTRNSPLFVELFKGLTLLVEAKHMTTIRLRERIVFSQKQQEVVKKLFAKLGIVASASIVARYSGLIERLKFLPEISTMEQLSSLAFVLLLSGTQVSVNQEILDEAYKSSVPQCPTCLSKDELIEILYEMSELNVR